MSNDGFTRNTATLEVQGRSYRYYPLASIEGAHALPYALKVLLENVLRNARSDAEAQAFAERILKAAQAGSVGAEIEFSPARVLFQDFTGVPVFVDFAVMREACERLGGDPSRINPQVPCDLVIDHSVIADHARCSDARRLNEAVEYSRNQERYSFLKWAQGSFDNVRIVPPGQGICHQLNIEKLAPVVMASSRARSCHADEGSRTSVRVASASPAISSTRETLDSSGAADESSRDGDDLPLAYFDTVVGTDSHTPTVNGLGVLGWGVGGIEAEAAALGQPITTLVPQVVAVKLTGSLAPGVSAMDVALTFAQRLREEGVVGCFVECIGPGVEKLSATQRACIANMTPEYGSTCTLFPVDRQTLDYLEVTGRSPQEVALVEAYAKAQGFWGDDAPRTYGRVIELDLSQVRPSAAGPSRPHDRVALADLQGRFQEVCEQRGCDLSRRLEVTLDGNSYELGDGAIAIAAVTSCTTATDPRMMLACGLLAKRAASAGLKAKPWVKTILAPGSRATELLLARAGLLEPLSQLGFHTCGFGCMSCIGNSGPLDPALHAVAGEIELASVLSGNRNFDGRISPDVSQNYLMAPAYVVAYALAGTVDFSLERDPLGVDEQGSPVYLRDLWPSDEEIASLVQRYVTADLYEQGSAALFQGDEAWAALPAGSGELFSWDEESTYVRAAPYFDAMAACAQSPAPVKEARILALLGDFITTDHISPAGSFAADTPAGAYLTERGVQPGDFNTYGSRRGNHEVLMRGTFGNVKLENALAKGRKGGWTTDFLTGEVAPIYITAMDYRAAGVPAVIVAGKMYGSGSSRDWAAKGPMLLGVKAVLAESYERIHRSNLIGMGILPLQFQEGQSAQSLGIQGDELISIAPIDFSQGLPDPAVVTVTATRPDGSSTEFQALVRVDTPTEGEYYGNDGILQYVLRSLM